MRRSTTRAVTTAAAGGLLAAGVLSAVPSGAAVAVPTEASAQLFDPAGNLVGRATFNAAADGVAISVDVQGAAPGKHGLHLHVNGNCAPAPDPTTGAPVVFGAAGGHFDPGRTSNHDRPDAPSTIGHAGDVPNLEVDADGTGHLEYRNTDVDLDTASLDGIVGRSIVLHAAEDDYMTDPAGNSGARIACGVVTAASTAVDARVVLPGTTTYPEGIAALPDGGALVGSSQDGTIHRIAADGTVSTFSPGGTDGRTVALGMAVDGEGRVFVAGGATGTIAVLDAEGSPLAMLETPGADATFINDVAVAPDGTVYATDSLRPWLFRIAEGDDGTWAAAPWLDLEAAGLPYGPGFNLNGLVVSESGSFIVAVQSNTGALWRIDTATGEVERLDTDGIDYTAGDGLVLVDPGDDGWVGADWIDGAPDLYVVRNAESTIERLVLDPAGRWAYPTGSVSDANLRFPTTAASTGAGLWVVNG